MRKGFQRASSNPTFIRTKSTSPVSPSSTRRSTRGSRPADVRAALAALAGSGHAALPSARARCARGTRNATGSARHAGAGGEAVIVDPAKDVRRHLLQQRLRPGSQSGAALALRQGAPRALWRVPAAAARAGEDRALEARARRWRFRAAAPARAPSMRRDSARSVCRSATRSSSPARSLDESHRPSFLFNPSNDAWFGAWGPPQHFAQARLRAIEEGVPVVRATPTGISGVIASDGGVVSTLPQNVAGVLDVVIPPPRAATLVRADGDCWSARSSACCSFAGG